MAGVSAAAAAKWAEFKPAAIALAIGLVVGPFVTNYLGWQVMSGTARTQMRAEVVEQQALICEERARAEVKEPGKLDWSARAELAKKWSVMPGVSPVADGEAVGAC